MTKDHGCSINNDKQYEGLRKRRRGSQGRQEAQLEQADPWGSIMAEPVPVGSDVSAGMNPGCSG